MTKAKRLFSHNSRPREDTARGEEGCDRKATQVEARERKERIGSNILISIIYS
jgi:hypothetical protein